MQRLLLICIVFFGFTEFTLGQSSLEELGQTTFYCFKDNNLDSFYRLKPTIVEITEFAKKQNIITDTNSAQYKRFLANYPNVIQKFKEKCQSILKDTYGLELNWTLAELEKIESYTKKLSENESDPNSRIFTITILEIFINSKGRHFKLTLGDVANYNGIWKPGNNIDIEEL